MRTYDVGYIIRTVLTYCRSNYNYNAEIDKEDHKDKKRSLSYKKYCIKVEKILYKSRKETLDSIRNLSFFYFCKCGFGIIWQKVRSPNITRLDRRLDQKWLPTFFFKNLKTCFFLLVITALVIYSLGIICFAKEVNKPIKILKCQFSRFERGFLQELLSLSLLLRCLLLPS